MRDKQKSAKDVMGRRLKQSEMLADLTQEIYTAPSIEEVLKIAVKHLSKVFPAYVSVNLVEEEGRFLVVKEHNVDSRLLDYAEKLIGRRFTNWKIPLYENTVISRTIRTGYPTVSNISFKPDESVVETDMKTMIEALVESSSPLRPFARPIAERVSSQSLLGIPFSTSSGEIIGSVTLVSSIPFDSSDFNLAKGSAAVIGRAIEQHLLSATLQDSEERYRSLQDNLPIGVFRTTPGGNLVTANPALLRMLGYSSMEEFKPVPIEDVYLDIAERDAFVNRLRKEGAVSDYEVRLKRKDDSFFLASMSARAVRGEDGEICYYDGILENVTTRKREELLREVRDQLLNRLRAAKTIDDCLRLGCEAVRDAGLFKRAIFTTKNSQGETTHFAQVGTDEKLVERLSKLPPASAQLFKKMLRDEFKINRSYFIPKEVGVDLGKTGRYILQDEKSGEGPEAWLQGDELFIPMLRMDGSIESWLSVDTPYNGKRPKRSIVLYLEDIADIVARQIHELENLEVLKSSEERFRSIVEITNEGVWLLDADAKTTYVNRRMAEILGYTTEEMTDRFLQNFMDKTAWVDAERYLLRLREGITEQYDFRFKHKNGSDVWTIVSATPLFTADGKYKGALVMITDITKRRQTEEALRESETRFRRFTGVVTDIIYRYDTERRDYDFISPSCESMTGYSAEEFKADPANFWQALIYPEDIERVAKERDKQLTSRSPDNSFSLDYRIICKDGKVICVNEHGNFELDEQGRIQSFNGVVRDITVRKHVEQALRESEERYRAFTEEALVGIYIYSNKMRKYLFVNPEMSRITGYTRQELLEIDPNQLPIPEDKNIIKEREEAVLKSKLIEPEYIIRICRKDSSVAVLSVRTHRISFEGEDVALGNCIDITVRRQAEERYREFTEQAMVGIYIFGENNMFLYVNPAMEQIFGYPREELLSKVPWDLVLPQDMEDVIKERDRARSRGEEVPSTYELRIMRKNGEVATLEIKAHEIHFGGKRAFLGNCIDITERKKAEEALRREKERIKKYLDISGVMLMALGVEGEVVMINKKGREILGCREEEIIGRNWFDNFLPQEIAPDIKGLFKGLMRGKKEPAMFFENPVLTKRGERRLVLWYNAILTDDAGNITGLLSSGEDITERRKAEEEIKKRNEELSALYETSVAVTSSLNEEKITNIIAQRAREVIDADGYIIYRYDEKLKKLVPQSTTLNLYRDEILAFSVPLGEGVTGQAAFQRRPIRANNAHLERQAKHIPGTPQNPTCIMAAPLVSRGELLGAITLTRLSENGFDEHDFGLFTLFAGQAADAAANSRLFNRLRESEERYRAFTEEAMVGVYIYRDGRFLFVNRAMEEITGYSREELLSQPSSLVTFPEDIPELEARQEARKRGEEVPTQYTMRVIHKDGRVRLIEVRTRAVAYDDATAYLGNCVDVTEIRKVQDALRDSEERYRILTEEAVVGVYILSKDRFRFANPAMEKILGYTREELINLNPWEIILPEDMEKVIAPREEARARGERLPGSYSIRVKRKNGDVAILELRTREIIYEGEQAFLGNCVDITEMRRIQEALARSEERYRILTEEAMMGVYLVRGNRFIFVNPAMERITGYSRDELLKIDAGQIILAEDLGVITERKKTRKAKEPDHYPMRIVRKNGEIAFLEVRTRPLGREGEETIYLGNCVDVTEIIRQRGQIEHAKQEWERTFDSISELVMIIDAEGRVIRANRAVAEYIESEISEIPGKSFGEIFHLEESDDVKLSFRISPKIPEQFEINDPMTKKVFFVTVAPVVSKPGEILGSVHVAHDITDMRRMEQALAQSEAQFRGLAESAQDIIFNLDIEGNVRYINPALKEIVGYDPTQAIGESLKKVFKDGRLLGESMDALIAFLDSSDSSERMPLFETEIHDIHGHLHVLEISSRRLDDGIVGIARDVTERKRMQQQLIQASKLASIGVLAAGIAHQVNNPLAIMLASSSLLRSILSKRQDMPEEIEEEITNYLDTMEEQVERTTRVVSGLLEFTKPKRFEVRPTDVNAVVSESLEWLSQHLSLGGLSVKMTLENDIPLALVDAVALQQVMVNVIQNAYEAMEGEGKLSIETRQTNEDRIHIVVTDTGPGIPPDMREEIFEPLFTTKSASKGTGLGLAISVMLLERFDGRIYLEDGSGQGATFVIEIPVARGDNYESL